METLEKYLIYLNKKLITAIETGGSFAITWDKEKPIPTIEDFNVEIKEFYSGNNKTRLVPIEEYINKYLQVNNEEGNKKYLLDLRELIKGERKYSMRLAPNSINLEGYEMVNYDSNLVKIINLAEYNESLLNKLKRMDFSFASNRWTQEELNYIKQLTIACSKLTKPELLALGKEIQKLDGINLPVVHAKLIFCKERNVSI